MRAFLKRWWIPILIGAAAAAFIWRKWPKTVRKITFTDLPVISGDAIASSNDGAAHGAGDDIDTLIKDSLISYDRA